MNSTVLQKSVYYPNLNFLRFIAAFLIIVHHIEQTKHMCGEASLWETSTIQLGFRLGLILFFVLSGFLITNLLQIEQKKTGEINIKNFYIRRILRIWPLYFLIIFLALFILPNFTPFQFGVNPLQTLHTNFTWKLLLFILLSPNLVIAIFGAIPFAAHTWSIGAEEQFYVLWPLVIKYIQSKFLFIFTLSLIILYLIIRAILTHYADDFTENKVLSAIAVYWNMAPLNCMATGGIFAIICNSTKPLFMLMKKIFFAKYVQYPVFIITPFLIAIGKSFYFFQYEVYSVLFGIIICNLALNSNRIIDFEKMRIFNYLGKISYGLYMFHPLVIIPIVKLLLKLDCQNNYILYALSFGLTILVSSISYHFYEKRFITKKIRYSALVSGDNAKTDG